MNHKSRGNNRKWKHAKFGELENLAGSNELIKRIEKLAGLILRRTQLFHTVTEHKRRGGTQ